MVTRSGRTVLGAALPLLLAGTLLAGCSDDPDRDAAPPPAEPETPAGPALPAETDFPSSGEVTDPVVEPRWLVRSTGTAESTEHDVNQQGMFVVDDVVVYFALDTVLGVSLEDGAELWRSPVDLGGEVVEYAGSAPHHEHLWTFAYPETASADLDERGTRLVTLDVRTGDVVANLRLGSFGGVEEIRSHADETFVVTDRGLEQVQEDGTVAVLTPQRSLGKEMTVSGIAPVRGADVLVLSLYRAQFGTDFVVGVDTTSGEILWRRRNAEFPTDEPPDTDADPSPADGRLILRESSATGADGELVGVKYLWLIDPATGRTLAQHRLPAERAEDGTYHNPMLASRDLYRVPRETVLSVEKDIVIEDGGNISRLDPATGEYEWTFDREPLQTTGEDRYFDRLTLGPVLPDGSVALAFHSSAAVGDLLALDLETGELVGRWAMDDAMLAGLVTAPMAVVHGADLVLARNRSIEGDVALLEGEEEIKPLGELNDLGLLAFPAAEEPAD
ncbi:outer membrane protein assembly factor BamB family protein [Nocardioides pantholopis]|uniref:outer membrane protein assembly factor BamB family protein n=1 Tax=Nocardioides pantholopis TaxID=2483798 RepID=UPI000F08D46F|nr:PQQ-binding-like beta-propeller repeat protein [Nocardioides pantholopis]